MKIAITALGKDLDAQVSDKPGTASHLLVIDTLSKELQCFEGPGKFRPGSGLQLVTMAINEKCDAFLAGWLSPISQRQLEARGITVVTGMTGKVAQALENLKFIYSFKGLFLLLVIGLYLALWWITPEKTAVAFQTSIDCFCRLLLPFFLVFCVLSASMRELSFKNK